MAEVSSLVFLQYAENANGDVSHFFTRSRNVSTASARLQILPFLSAAQNIGWSTTVWSLHSDKPDDLNKIAKINNIKELVVGKMSTNSTESIDSMIMANSAAIFNLKAENIPLTLLYSDNHLARNDEIGKFYQKIILHTNRIITPSESLRDEVNIFTGGKINVHVIKDPWQIPKELPFKKTEQIQEKVDLIWFGNALNIEYLIQTLPTILSTCNCSNHYHLKILTRTEAIRHFKANMPDEVSTKKKWTIEYITWDDYGQPSQFLDALANAHLSIIPSNPNDPKKLGVSHNRLVDSTRSGCITIASPLKSYLELQKTALLGDDFPAMIDFAILNYTYLCEKFEANRESLLSEFDPEINMNQWKHFMAILADTQNKD